MWPFFGLVVALFILVIISSVRAKKAAEARRAELMTLAAQWGFNYDAGSFADSGWGLGFNSGRADILPRFEDFHPFGIGHSPAVQNLLYGQRNGIDWTLFDYSYKVTTSNGKSTTTTTYPVGVVAARIPVALPWIHLSQEDLFTRIGAKFGMQDLTFESEEFNRRYRVQASMEKEAYAILHPQAIEYLLRHPIRRWQMSGPQIVITTSQYLSTDEMFRIMEEIQDFVEMIPPYVREDRGFPGVWSSPH